MEPGWFVCQSDFVLSHGGGLVARWGLVKAKVVCFKPKVLGLLWLVLSLRWLVLSLKGL